MDGPESKRTECREDDSGKTLDVAEISSTLPYYCSWYRLIFSRKGPVGDDKNRAAEKGM